MIDLSHEESFCFGCCLFICVFAEELIKVGIFFITLILVNFLLLQKPFSFLSLQGLKLHFIFYFSMINFSIFILFIKGILICHQDFIKGFFPFKHSRHNWLISIQIIFFFEFIFIINLRDFFLFFCIIIAF